MNNDLKSIARLGFHQLNHVPNVETVDLCTFRAIDKSAWRRIASCNWLRRRKNALLLGPHGIGKTYISAAICNEALPAGYSIRRTTHSNLQLALNKPNNFEQMLVGAHTNLLIVDDFLPQLPIDPDKDEQLWKFLADRQSHDSVMLISTLPPYYWRLPNNPQLLFYVNTILMNTIILEIRKTPCSGLVRKLNYREAPPA